MHECVSAQFVCSVGFSVGSSCWDTASCWPEAAQSHKQTWNIWELRSLLTVDFHWCREDSEPTWKLSRPQPASSLCCQLSSASGSFWADDVLNLAVLTCSSATGEVCRGRGEMNLWRYGFHVSLSLNTQQVSILFCNGPSQVLSVTWLIHLQDEAETMWGSSTNGVCEGSPALMGERGRC